MRDVFLITILLMGFANAEQIAVDSQNHDINDIQNALDNSKNGDIITVGSGIYHGNLFVRKGVSLVGKDTGEGLPVIDADGSGNAITLNADGIFLTGFNLTNSGHCGCGNAGIRISSGNSTVTGNIAYKNKYGIYAGETRGNRIYGNDLKNNDINAYDIGKNYWSSDTAPGGIWDTISKLFNGSKPKGNHYSDYDEPAEGCIDENKDRICDRAYNITGGTAADAQASIL